MSDIRLDCFCLVGWSIYLLFHLQPRGAVGKVGQNYLKPSGRFRYFFARVQFFLGHFRKFSFFQNILFWVSKDAPLKPLIYGYGKKYGWVVFWPKIKKLNIYQKTKMLTIFSGLRRIFWYPNLPTLIYLNINLTYQPYNI